MVWVTGIGRSTILQYRDLAYSYRPESKKTNKDSEEKEGSNNEKIMETP